MNTRHLASFVQNDFKRCLEDGWLDEDALKTMLSDVDTRFDDFIKTLNNYRKETKSLIEHQIEKL